MKILTMVGAVLLCALCTPAIAKNQPKSWQELCRQVAGQAFPAEDRPAPDMLQRLKDCSSYDLYYGFNQDPDPEMARLCAYDEMNRQEDAGPFHGAAMLITMYANGVGARRNLDLAIKLACTTGWAPAEIEGRVQHLAELRDRHWQGHDFSFCDDVTSGYMAGFCADHGEKFASRAREERLDRVQAGWTAARMKGYETLRAVADRYFEIHADKEVDQGGTARAALFIADTAAQEEQFVAMLELLQNQRFPRYTRSQFEAADARLNALYGKIQASDDGQWGTVTRTGIRDTQRFWLRYRDAWLAFCKTQYPGCSGDSIKAYLTEKRIAELKEFAD